MMTKDFLLLKGIIGFTENMRLHKFVIRTILLFFIRKPKWFNHLALYINYKDN